MKNRSYIWSLIILVIVSLGLLILLKPWATSSLTFEDLLLNDGSKINRIQIRGMNDTLEFNNEEGNWMMGEEILNQKTVDNLLIAAGNFSKKSVVMQKDILAKGPMSEVVFSSGLKALARFNFLFTGSNLYIFDAGDERAYGVELLGYEKYSLGKIFSHNPDHYRVHVLIDLLPDEIRSIYVEPIKGSPFLAKQDSGHNISVFDPLENIELTNSLDEEKVRLLFSYLNSIRYESVLSALYTDSLRLQSLEAISTIEVYDFMDRRWKFEVFEWKKQDENFPDMFRALVRFNEGPEYLVVKYAYLDLLMRGVEIYNTTQVPNNY